jgi:predicted HicB family RNase H-like nuclease
MNLLKYKGYEAVVINQVDDALYYGWILDIDELVNFSGETPQEAGKNFHSAVDEYIRIKNN